MIHLMFLFYYLWKWLLWLVTTTKKVAWLVTYQVRGNKKPSLNGTRFTVTDCVKLYGLLQQDITLGKSENGINKTERGRLMKQANMEKILGMLQIDKYIMNSRILYYAEQKKNNCKWAWCSNFPITEFRLRYYTEI